MNHEEFYAELYQIVGHLAGEAGLFETEQVQDVLHALHHASGGQLPREESFLPFNPTKGVDDA